MKTPHLISMAMAAVLCLSQGAVWAQPGHGNDCGSHCDRDRDRGRMNDRNDHRGHKDRFQNGHDHRPDMRSREDWRGAGPSRNIYRGEYLPPYYRGRQYVVDDWRGHGLRPPPRGHRWVQIGADYVLVAIATGVIVELLLNP